MNTMAQSYTPHEQQMLNIFRRHVDSFTSGNIDSVMNDFSQQSIVITPDGVFEGLDRIRTLYQGLLAEFGTIARGDSPGFVFDALHIRHDILFITWHAESIHHIFPFGTDTFICRDGKFACQSIAFSPLQPRNIQPG